MRNQYARDYYDFLQSMQDREDELAQRKIYGKKIGEKRLRQLARALEASVTAIEEGTSKNEIAALWMGYASQETSLKPITKLLFGN